MNNNSRITINVDGQKFSVIVRLLKPEEKVRVTSKMDILVSTKVYVWINTKIELIVSDSQYAYTEKECKITNSSIKLTKVEKE